MKPESLAVEIVGEFSTDLGGALARNIIDGLGRRASFPDPAGETKLLHHILEELSAVQFSEPELMDRVGQRVAEVSTQAQRDRLHNHRTMLRGNRILLPDDDESEEGKPYRWADIRSDSQPAFAARLDQVDEALKAETAETQTGGG